MLDQETKRKIDNARDILVGKVPDPKSQVEQITIALIYKFMDDMDKESIALGGKAAFFKGEFEKYTWSRIFDPRLGGHDLITLYGEAITKMNHNENIPQLFRDIFKNAFLPYRDPETLKSFLKEINEFKYDHSEKLGDAFEYLLSVLGSQGDAGQFRTPRHIIDFIVEVVDPKKNETILDPACATAGFLISSYKHILKQNTKERKGDCLTMDERKRLMNSLVGYDISPDMVRLSLVNMYLHGFQTPKIYEYDTLTSEERWDESYDVILANPPFMTPKGGIRPHKRFSVQANRSEVLFVDYIMEHLTINGRAGVIVPEGIIFQSANAYKALRKLLVESGYLFAVVSLPQGVFQPYSGVKTCILLMDKSLAKRAQDILFVKIENEGFDLGAQRRAIDKNNLPGALEILLKYKRSLQEGKECEFSEDEKRIAHRVAKLRIADGGDYNLSGERYKEVAARANGGWEMVELGEICDVRDGTHDSPKYQNQGFPLVTSKNIIGGKIDFSNVNFISLEDLEKINKRSQVDDGDIIMPMIGTIGNPIIVKKDRDFAIKNVALIKFNDKSKIDRYFLKYILGSELFNIQYQNFSNGSTQKFISLGFIRNLKIPLPPLSVQQEIVDEIEGYQKIIDGARQVVENYKPKIKVEEGWEVVELETVMKINSETENPLEKYGDNEFYYIDISSVENGSGYLNLNNKIKGTEAPSRARRTIRNGDVLLSTVRPNLKAFTYLSDIPENSIASTGFAVLTQTDKIMGKYVYYMLFDNFVLSQMIDRMGKGAYPSINQKDVEQLKIPLPPFDVQKEIVARIEEEQKLVAANKKLIEIFEGKIKEKVAEVWG